MLIQPIDIFVYVWLVVAVLSAAYVAWDQFVGNPEPPVMKWGFVLVTLYMGPIGLLLYVMADKEPTPGHPVASNFRPRSACHGARVTFGITGSWRNSS